MTYIGYGSTGEVGGSPGDKNVALVPVYDVDAHNIYAFDEDKLKPSNVCHGDSGGAALRYEEDVGYSLVGVSSAIFGGCEGGGSSAARVDGVLDFIDTLLLDYATNEQFSGESVTDDTGGGSPGGF